MTIVEERLIFALFFALPNVAVAQHPVYHELFMMPTLIAAFSGSTRIPGDTD